MGSEASPCRVFISYSHDSSEHGDRVLALADRLRQDGIDCVLDQYILGSPAEGWPLWMDRQVCDADFVLMICTPTYHQRVMGEVQPGIGHGVRWEGNLVYQHFYNDGTINTHFLPILLEGASASNIPLPFQGVAHYQPMTEKGYEALYRRLTNQPLTPPPDIGTPKQLPPRERPQPAFGNTPGIQIGLIVFVILFVIGGGLGSFLAFKGSPTATPQGTVQTHSTVTPQGTAQPQNTTTPTASGLKLAWTYATKGHIEESSPVVANGMVYIGSLDHKLYAIDAKTGAYRWAYTTVGPIRSSPAVNDGMVYVGSLDHNLYALDALSGVKQWSYSTGDGIYSSPVVANGILYFGSDDGHLYALDARSGMKKWLHSTSAQIVSTPAVANDTVYFGSEDDYFYALDAASGAMKWSKNTGNAITSSPTVALADNIVYIISWTGTLTAYDTGSGAKVWDQSAGGNGSSPTVAKGVLYIGDNVSYILYALDSTSGAVQWHYPQFYTPPANGVTYQPSLPDAGITSSPVVANGVVYIGSADYNLYAIDTKSGKELASYATGGSILSSPLVANGMVYVGSSDNKLYAFHLPGTSS